MTRFTVIWDPDAEAQLAEIWLQSGSRKSVTDAAGLIDSILLHDPELQGRNLAEGLRILDVEPLEIIFAVSLPDRIANILVVKPLT